MIHRLRSRHTHCVPCDEMIFALNGLDRAIEEARQTLEKSEQLRRVLEAKFEEHKNNA